MRALNEPTAEPIKHHQVVHGRMKDSFTSMYQTILSIIQGVALADLAMFVVAKYPQFTVVHWLMVLTTFFMFIVVFNVYSIQSAVWDWIPDIRDESIPFVFGALELFVNHAIALSTSLWFLGLAGISALGAVGTVHLMWRAHEESENTELLGLLRPHHRLFILNYIGGAALALLFAYICYVGNLQASDGVQGMRGLLTLGLVLLIAVSLDGSALVSNRYWRKAVMYARTGECQICIKNRKRSLQGKNPLTGGRAQRDLTRATSLLGNGQGRRSDFVAQHLKNAPGLIGQQVKEDDSARSTW